MLEIHRLSKDSKDFPEFKRLYHSSFPKSELVPLKFLLGHKDTEIEAYYDEDGFCGFYCALVFGKMMNIMFFAIEERMRNHGIGSMILNNIKNNHPGFLIMLDVEMPIDNAVNNNERIQRKNFYYHNGFKDTEIKYKWHGTDYQMMVYGGELSKEEYEMFMSNLDKARFKEFD